MPDSGPGEGHVDHQQTEDWGTTAWWQQCLLPLFNLGNFKKPRRKRNGYVVIKCLFIRKGTGGVTTPQTPPPAYTSSLFVNKCSTGDVTVYSLLLSLSCIEGYECRLCIETFNWIRIFSVKSKDRFSQIFHKFLPKYRVPVGAFNFQNLMGLKLRM
jgi:hypothetical protein